ncbi:hypothetical protein ONZ45_g9219 [Pleurotus djamor]|nr:hypothetical protein ONZ45_g9219 [Pleurotus djamor]
MATQHATLCGYFMDRDASKTIAVKLGMDPEINSRAEVRSFISEYAQKRDVRIKTLRRAHEDPCSKDLKYFFPTTLNMGPIDGARYEKCPFDEDIGRSTMSILGLQEGELRWGSVSITHGMFWKMIRWYRRPDRDLLQSGYIINKKTCLEVAIKLGLEFDGHDGDDALVHITDHEKFKAEFPSHTMRTIHYGYSPTTGPRSTEFDEEAADKVLKTRFMEFGGIEEADIKWVTLPYYYV